jgi:hypothetical protein
MPARFQITYEQMTADGTGKTGPALKFRPLSLKEGIFMQGTIASYNESVKSGVIRARNGELFCFIKSDYSSGAGRQPIPGMVVLFDVGEKSAPAGYAYKIKPANDLMRIAVSW